jgi:Fungal specific transcription factor domain
MLTCGRYYRYYHPRFLFLPSKEKILQDCGTCHLLFWAVVAVSSRSVPECKEFRKGLTWPLRRLAMESAIRETPSLPLIQAYLLLCVWAMPFGAVTDDPCWTYCGIATHKAQQLGLHRPNHLNEFVAGSGGDHELLASMRNTWLACFIVNQKSPHLIIHIT